MSRRENNPILALTNFREIRRLVRIEQQDRFLHLYIVGATGTGKSTLLQALIRQDIEASRGLGFLDPHGDTVARLAKEMTDGRRGDLVYLDVPNLAESFAFNPLDR